LANREIGVAPLVIYLAAWWGFVVAVVLWLTSNAAPGAPVLAFKDPAYFVTSKLEVVAKDAVDPDGDHVEYAYTWYRNGELQEDLAGPTVAVGKLRQGDVWKVVVVPNDGSEGSLGCGIWDAWRSCAGDVSAETEITISNTPPQARVRVVDAKGQDVGSLTGADLGLVLGCYDPDLIQKERDEEQAKIDAGTPTPPPAEGETPAPKPDPCTYKVAWYAGDAPALPNADPGKAAATDPAAAPAPAPAAAPAEPPVPKFTFTDGTTVSAKDLKASKVWRVHVVANDGEVDGPISEVVLETPAE
jgi:hypothetical protein